NQGLKLSVLRGPGVGDDVPDIAHARDKLHHALKTQSESGVNRCAEPSQVQIPPEFLFIDIEILELLLEHFQAFLPLGSPDDLPDSGEQHVHGTYGLSILVQAHIEGLDVRRVIKEDHRAVKVFFNQIALVFAL